MRSPRRRWLVRVLGGLVALLLLAGVGGYWYARPLLLTGTGYAAHNACAVGFVAGREDADDDLPPNPLVPYLRSTLDSADHVASTSLFGVLARQRAWYSPGYGCTLADQRPSFAAAPPPAGANPLAAPAPAPPATAAEPVGRPRWARPSATTCPTTPGPPWAPAAWSSSTTAG